MQPLSNRDRLDNYLIDKALTQYNDQFGSSLTSADFELNSSPAESYAFAYELTPVDGKQLATLKIFINVEYYESLSLFQQATIDKVDLNSYADDIFVAVGTMSANLIESARFNIKNFVIDNKVREAFITEDYDVWILEDSSNGENFLMVEHARV